MRSTSTWWLVPPWALALVGVVLGASSDHPVLGQSLAVAGAFLLGCAARVLAPVRRLATPVLVGACLCGVVAVAQSVAAIPADAVSPVVSVLGTLALAVVPTRALAVLRSRGIPAGDAELRLVAWAQASTAAGGVALAVLQVAPPAETDEQGVQAWASAAFALVLVTAFAPLAALNNRVVARGRADPAATMIAVARQVAADPEGGPETLDRICAELRSAWDVAEVVIVRDSAPPALDATGGGEVHAVSLTSGGEAVGRLVVRAHSGRDLGSVRGMVDRSASLLGASLALSDLSRGTEAMRRRITGARDAERTLLTRELSEQIVPAVRGVAAGLRDTARALERDPATAPDLGDLTDQLGRSTGDVRRIARALLPGALDRGDLEGAFRELLSQPGLSPHWTLRADGADELDPATQRATYLVLADLLDEVKSLRVGAAIDVVLVREGEETRLQLSMPGQVLPTDTRRRLREAIERHASHFVLTVRGLPEIQGVEVVVRR